jgi:hypothetical protein
VGTKEGTRFSDKSNKDAETALAKELGDKSRAADARAHACAKVSSALAAWTAHHVSPPPPTAQK